MKFHFIDLPTFACSTCSRVRARRVSQMLVEVPQSSARRQ